MERDEECIKVARHRTIKRKMLNHQKRGDLSMKEFLAMS
jgi:hypothetical protein